VKNALSGCLYFRTYVLNDSAYIGYATLLYCCVLLINDDNDELMMISQC